MKTRTILCGIALMMSCAAAYAQKITSITVGVSPYGFAHSVVFWDKDHEYNYKYKPSIGANICFEKQGDGISSLTEISYYQADYDSHKFPKTDPAELTYNLAQKENLMQMALTQYWGGTLFGKNKRVQLPLYAGIGCGYVKGGSLHNVTGDVALKLRLKFYISNHIGIYAGGTGRLGIGMKDNKNGNDDKTKHLTVGNGLITADAGIIISL